jgi:hypothetical protein
MLRPDLFFRHIGFANFGGKTYFMELSIIQQMIYEIRGQKVMLDFDLAKLYEVPTKALNQAL